MKAINGAGLELLRRNKNFRRYYYARTASVIGSQWTYAAVPLVALAVYRDPLAAGVASACGYGGNIAFGLFAGAIIDHVPHRAVMLLADATRFLLLLYLGLLFSAGTLPNLAVVYSVVVAVAIMSAAFDAANAAIAPSLVDPNDFPQTMTMRESRDALICVVMPIASTALLLRHPGLPFLVDSTSYLVSFVLIWGVQSPKRDDNKRHSEREGPSWWQSVTAGFAELARNRSLAGLTLGSSILNFGLQACVYIALYRAVWAGHASLSGAILGMQAVGMFVGAVFAKRLFTATSPAQVTALHALIWAVGFVLLAVARLWWTALIVLPLMWVTAPVFRTVVASHTAAVIPAETMGRVYAASGLLMMTMAAGSQTIAALSVTHDATVPLLVLLALASSAVLVGGVVLPVRRGRMSFACRGKTAEEAG
jgi:MFS family permease